MQVGSFSNGLQLHQPRLHNKCALSLALINSNGIGLQINTHPSPVSQFVRWNHIRDWEIYCAENVQRQRTLIENRDGVCLRVILKICCKSADRLIVNRLINDDRDAQVATILKNIPDEIHLSLKVARIGRIDHCRTSHGIELLRRPKDPKQHYEAALPNDDATDHHRRTLIDKKINNASAPATHTILITRQFNPYRGSS